MAEQKVAVITGGTRGIGRAISMALAESGVHVCAGYQSNREAAESMREAAKKMGQSVSIHQMEVGEPDDCVRFVNDAIEEHGHVDYLINNAGINIDRTVRRMTIDEWHGVMRINISGCFYMIKAVIEHMISRGSGRIVNISSIIGETGNVGQANYATAKSGMHGLTKTLALELAGKGITVNCVAPGFISTDMMASVPEAVLEKIVARIPIGRLGKPEEVAYVVTSLLDDRASYVTGAVISVNGGLDMQPQGTRFDLDLHVEEIKLLSSSLVRGLSGKNYQISRHQDVSASLRASIAATLDIIGEFFDDPGALSSLEYVDLDSQPVNQPAD